MQKIILSLIAPALMAGLAVAQCNPVPPFTTMTTAGNGQKGTMFNIVNNSTAPATIQSFDQCFLNAGTSDVEIYTKTGTWSGFESTPAAWTLVGTALGVIHTAAPTLDPIPLAVNVSIPGGATQAFYITSNATFATNVAYTSGVNQLGAVIGTDGILSVTGGVGKTYPFGSTFGLPTAGRLWNGRVHYCIVGTPATNQTLGLGCIRAFTSFYEMFPLPANFDLPGMALTMSPAGGSYVVTPGGAFLPVGSVQALPTALALGDDAGIAQPFTVGSFPGPNGPWAGVWVISNGCVSDIAGNTTVAAPNPLTMLGAPNPGFYTQGDWDPMLPGGGAGTIWFEESASVVTVTWDNVQSWNNPGSVNTFQIQLHSSGTVVIAWVAMAAVGSNGGVLVGYSPGGPSANPGSTDLSTTLFPAGSIILTATDGPPALALAGSSRPVTGTSWNLDVTNIPAAGTFGLEIFGLADPGINDLFFLGAPGCGLRSTLDALNVWLVAALPTHSYSLPIPANPVLIGAQLFSTAAVFVPGVNPLFGGTITANGVKGTVGDV